MRNRFGFSLIALLVACGGSPTLQVGGHVAWETIEGGFWSIHGDDGVTYDPRSLPPAFQQDGLAVFAELVVRRDLASAHMVGPVVDVVRIQQVPGFAAAWKGTKNYLADDGSVAAWAPGWAFEIRMTAPDAVHFVNGPDAKISAGGLEVSRYAYPPAYPPGPQGMCTPIMNTITSGSGTLGEDGSLSLTLHWTHSCGGATSQDVTTYSMNPIAALAAWETSQL